MALQIVPIVTPIVSKLLGGIFKKPQTKDGWGKLAQNAPDLFSQARTTMTRTDYNNVAGQIRATSSNWTKAQKKSIENNLKKISVVPDSPPPPVPETHTLSASYDTTPATQGIQTSRNVNEPVLQATGQAIGIGKTPLYIGLGIAGLLVIILVTQRR